MKKRAGLFLDRDGTIIYDKGYMRHPNQIELLPGAREAMTLAQQHFRLYMLTNQSGIGRGLFTIEAVHACNARMNELLGLPEPLFEDICIAPEKPGVPSLYRKPSPLFIREKIAEDSLDPEVCWMAGDRLSDIKSGTNARIKSALIRQSIHSEKPHVRAFAEKHSIPSFTSLLEFIHFILNSKN